MYIDAGKVFALYCLFTLPIQLSKCLQDFLTELYFFLCFQEKGLLQRNSSSAGSSRLGSDGRSLGRGSDSGAGSERGSQLNPSDRIASMYDSLAAELREKLTGKEPLLLPPRDYDTMHRSQGNIFGEQRRSIVVGAGEGPRVKEETGIENCSRESSGIGSDCNPSSPLDEPIFHGQSSSSGTGTHCIIYFKHIISIIKSMLIILFLFYDYFANIVK